MNLKYYLTRKIKEDQEITKIMMMIKILIIGRLGT